MANLSRVPTIGTAPWPRSIESVAGCTVTQKTIKFGENWNGCSGSRSLPAGPEGLPKTPRFSDASEI